MSVVKDKARAEVYICVFVASQLVTDAQFEGTAKDVYEEGILATPQSFSKPKRNIRALSLQFIKPLTPNDLYMGRTALLTSKVAFYIFIQQI